jgi:hypothetical protein
MPRQVWAAELAVMHTARLQMLPELPKAVGRFPSKHFLEHFLPELPKAVGRFLSKHFLQHFLEHLQCTITNWCCCSCCCAVQGIDSFAADQKKLEEQLAKLVATL